MHQKGHNPGHHALDDADAYRPFPPSSRRTEVMAATQGVYSRVKVKNTMAVKGVNRPLSAAVLPPSSTVRVLTTFSLAAKPLIKAVDTIQLPNPKGAKIGAIQPPIMASRLSPWSVTTLNW